jgi:hypothetical protein
MTSMAMCLTCSNLEFTMDATGNEVQRKGEIGMVSSCCNKCSNPSCPEYGKCTCLDSRIESTLDLLEQKIREGTFPLFKHD